MYYVYVYICVYVYRHTQIHISSDLSVYSVGSTPQPVLKGFVRGFRTILLRWRGGRRGHILQPLRRAVLDFSVRDEP